MSIFRPNPKRDVNDAEITQALRQIGALVYHIGQPVDKLIWYRNRWSLMEIKAPKGKVQAHQKEFCQMTNTPIVESVDQAIEALRF